MVVRPPKEPRLAKGEGPCGRIAIQALGVNRRRAARCLSEIIKEPWQDQGATPNEITAAAVRALGLNLDTCLNGNIHKPKKPVRAMDWVPPIHGRWLVFVRGHTMAYVNVRWAVRF